MIHNNFCAGLTGLQLPLEADEVDLGQGLGLRRTYAHLMSSYTMAFNPPKAPGKHHPAPWKATTRHDRFDVHVELVIPSGYNPPGDLTPYDVVRTITSVLRLLVDPTIRSSFNRAIRFPKLRQCRIRRSGSRPSNPRSNTSNWRW